MAKIKVNVDTLRDNANQVTRQIQALESLNSRLDQLLNQIEGSWTGNASEQYLATVKPLYDKYLRNYFNQADVIVMRGGRNTRIVVILAGYLRDKLEGRKE